MRKIIAIIDDELVVRETIKEMLLASIEVDVETFCSVDEFLDAAAAVSFNLILSDIHMPSGSGLILVENELVKETPLIYMSGFSDFIPKDESLTILRKPLTISKLIEVVEPLLKKSA